MGAWPVQDADRLLREATVRLVTADGAFAGTGFVVGPEGRILTCHHVVAGHEGLRALDAQGRGWEVIAEADDDADLARSDLAVMQLTGAEGAPPPPLPLALRPPGPAFRSRAQHADAQAFRDPVPLSGALGGAMRISYGEDPWRYEVDALPVTGVQVQGGMSGAAVWDEAAGAVVGVLAVAAGDANLGGLAIPLLLAQTSRRLQALVAENDATVPRHGDRPNAFGLADLLRAATQQTYARLIARGIVQPERYVPREGFAEALEGFLTSRSTALAIVSAAGQGKTSLLCQVSALRPERPAWLVRAADLGADDAPGEGLNRLLRKAGAPAGLAWPGMAAASGVAPLLLLDGLNEAPIAERRLASDWLPDLVTEAADAGWRLIYTTRRELFAALPEALRQAQRTFELGRFTGQEAAAAAKAYGGKAASAEREPLLLRIRAETGTKAPRSRALEMFVRRLLDEALAQAPAGHPAAVMDRLGGLAERAAADDTGLAAYDDPFFADAALTAALCEANLLEEVPAGYRFVFDEVADYLHARSVARAMAAAGRVDAALAPRVSVNVLALSLEALADLKAGELAVSAANDLADAVAGTDYAQAMHAFAAVAALPLTSDFEAAKMRAAQAAAANDIVSRFAMSQPGLLTALPLEAVKTLAREAILDQSGYGWREKDIWSEHHRAGTVQYARLELGIFRLIHELLDDPDVDGAGLLIAWLSDPTRLSEGRKRYANSEATVGSFALCMLFAYREIVGLQRLFDEVLWAEAPGYGSLLQALAAEETEALASWLESLEPSAAAARIDFVCGAWGYVLPALRETDPAAADRRVADAMARIAPVASGPAFGRLVTFVVGRRLPLRDAAALARRATEAGLLDPFTLSDIIRAGFVGLDDVLDGLSARLRDTTIFQLAGKWNPGDEEPSIARLATLLRATASFSRGFDDGRYDLETLLWRLDLATAQASGVCALLDEALEADAENGRLAGFLVNTGFAGAWSKPSEGQAAFRSWVAERILPRLREGGELQEALGRSLEDEETFARCRPFALELARRVSAWDLVVMMFQREVRAYAGLREVFEAFFAVGPDEEDRDLVAVQRAAVRVMQDEPPAPYELHEMAYEHITATQEARSQEAES